MVRYVPPLYGVKRRRGLPSLLRVIAGLAIGVIAVFALGIALYADQTDPGAARALAARELNVRALEEGERVRRIVPVYRRRLWDYYRATYGLLVATDRRMLFIGLPPTIRASAASDGEPPLIEEIAFSYDDVSVSVGRVFLGQADGIAFRTPSGRERFGIAAGDRAELDSLAAVIENEQETRRVAAERERASREEAARRARAPICHRVRRGEALDLIAARYGTTTETLKQLNGLTSSRIRAGDTILVRAGNPVDAGGRRCEVLTGDALGGWGFADPRAAADAPGAP